MIRARSQAEMSDVEPASVKSPASRPAESGTLASEVGHSPKDTKPKAKRKRASKAKGKLLRKIAAAKRREREVLRELREKTRSVRDFDPLKPRKKASRPAGSGTFHVDMGQQDPTVAAPTATPSASDPTPPAGECAPSASEAATAASAEAPPADDLTPRLLNEKKSLALVALLQGESNTDAAKAAGVDRRTVFRWRQEEEFQAELHRIQSYVCTALRTTSADLADESVQVIKEAIDKGQISAALDLLKAVKILNGQPLTDIDGLDAEKPDPVVVFAAPAAAPEIQTETAAPDPAVQIVSATVEPVKSQTPDEPLDLEDLLPKQQVAIVQLLAGRIVPEAAQEAGVAIHTLQRWLRSDESFRQVLRHGRQEQAQQLQTKLLTGSLRALDVLRIALKHHRNVRVAFAVLRGLGVVK